MISFNIPFFILLILHADATLLVFRYTRKTRSNMTLARLRTTMYNAKMAKYPKIRPYTLRELSRTLLQHGFVAATIDEAENLYAGSITATDGSHHLAFFSPRMLHFMGQIKIIHGDGTFKSRPTLPASSQIFALVTTWNHCVSLQINASFFCRIFLSMLKVV